MSSRRVHQPLVTRLNTLRNTQMKTFVVRPRREGVFGHSKQESDLSDILGIDEGTVFTFSHETNYGIRHVLEQLKLEGLIKRYGEGPQFADYPKIHFATIIFVNSENGGDQRARGYTPLRDREDVCLVKALHEAVERHATYYDPSSKTVTYPDFHRGDASFLYPLVPHFSEAQTGLYSFLAGSPEDLKDILGFRVNSLTGGPKRFLPYHCFYFGKLASQEDVPVLFHPTSNGSGAGTTVVEATLSALYELIERDHFLLYWLAKVQPSEITLDEESTFGHTIASIKKRYNLEIYFFDMRHDFPVKACLALIIDPVLNLVSCGAKVGQDAQYTLEGAYLEAIAVLDAIRQGGDKTSGEELRSILEVPFPHKDVGMRKRVNMYCSAEGIAIIRKRLLGVRSSVPFSRFAQGANVFKTKKGELDFLLDAFKAKIRVGGEGYEVYRHEHESRYTKMIHCSVVHVFVPALIKLYLSEMYITPVSDRLTHFARTHGKSDFSEKEVETLPHFFP